MPESPYTKVRIRAVNNKADVEAIVQTPRGRIVYEGDTVIDGVPGTGAPIILKLFFFSQHHRGAHGKDVAHGFGFGLPGDGVAATCLDVAMPMAIVRAADLGVAGDAPPSFYNRDSALLERSESLRRLAERMGLGDVAGQVTPKVALVSPARHGGTFTSRYFVPEKCHATHAVTGHRSRCRFILDGSVFADFLTIPSGGPLKVEVEHPARGLRVPGIF